jgi:hypothetical protein
VSIEETLAGKLESRFEVVSAYADDWPNVMVGGVEQFAYWNDHVYALKGEAVTVAREVDPSGIARNTVIGRIGRPGADTGTVLTVESNYLLVSVGADEVRARFDPDKTYTPGDIVALDWKGSTITALFVVTDYVPPAVDIPATTAPPPANNSGELSVFATDSGTWVPSLGYWNVWAAKNQNVYTGSYGGYTMVGSWFFNGATRQLAGAVVTRVRFRVPKRFSVGAYNSTGTLHIYVHTSDTRPGGDVARVTGPYDIAIPPNFQGGFVDLPLAAGDQLKNGGGISIAGDPYMGFQGKAVDPASGQLLVGWSR